MMAGMESGERGDGLKLFRPFGLRRGWGWAVLVGDVSTSTINDTADASMPCPSESCPSELMHLCRVLSIMIKSCGGRVAVLVSLPFPPPPLLD